MATKSKAAKAEEDKAVQAALKRAAAKCTPDAKKHCQGMAYALFFQSELGGGMEVGLYLNLHTGREVGTRFIYRTTRGNKILRLNFCPWCGEKVGA